MVAPSRYSGDILMSIRKYLSDPDITAEVARTMALAYDTVRATIKTKGMNIPAEIIAHRIAECAVNGTHDAHALVRIALASFLESGTEVSSKTLSSSDAASKIA